MNKAFRPTTMETVKFVQTEVLADGYSFTVKANCLHATSLFVKLYVEDRKKEFANDGKVWSEDVDQGYKNLIKVLKSGDYRYEFHEYEHDVKVPAAILCCNEWLELTSFTNTCEICEDDYNASGQLLAPRHFWGEETGEHWTECY